MSRIQRLAFNLRTTVDTAAGNGCFRRPCSPEGETMSKRFLPLLLCSAAVLGGTAPRGDAAEPPVIPRKVFFGNPDKAGGQISPDGKTLSFLAPVDGVMNVHVCPVGADLASAKVVTK